MIFALAAVMMGFASLIFTGALLAINVFAFIDYGFKDFDWVRGRRIAFVLAVMWGITVVLFQFVPPCPPR